MDIEPSTVAILDMLTRMKRTFNQRSDDLGSKVTSLVTDLDTICTTEFSRLGSDVESMNRQFLVFKDEVGSDFGSVDRLLKSALYNINDLMQETTTQGADTKLLKEEVKGIKKGVDELRVDVKELRTDVKELESNYTGLHARVVQLDLRVVVGAPHGSTLPSNETSSAVAGHTIEVTPSDDTSAPLTGLSNPTVNSPGMLSEGSFMVAGRLNILKQKLSLPNLGVLRRYVSSYM